MTSSNRTLTPAETVLVLCNDRRLAGWPLENQFLSMARPGIVGIDLGSPAPEAEA